MSVSSGAFLDAGDYYGRDDTSDVPPAVLADVRRQLTAHRAQHGRGTYPQTHTRCGTNRDRQWVGRPGHCSVCAVVGHVVAHPERGCADVGCNDPHDEPAAGPGRESALSPAPAGSLAGALASVCESALSAADTAVAAGLGAGEETLDRAMGAVAALGARCDRAIETGLCLLDRAAARVVSWVVKF